MRHLLPLILALPLVGCPSSSGPSGPTGLDIQEPEGVATSEVKSLTDGVNAFGFELFKQLAKKKRENVFLSGLSVESALAMTYAGALQETAAEMEKTLRLPGAQTHPTFQALLHAIAAKRKREHELMIANRLWVRPDFALLDPYRAVTQQSYGAGATPLDFQKDPAGAAAAINAWASENTRNRIPQVVTPDLFRGSDPTKLVLTNAIYFKGKWADAFKASATRPVPFFASAKQPVQAPMMHRGGKIAYAELPGLQAVDLGYRGGEVSMLVLLPRKKDGIGALERSLDGKLYQQVVGGLRPRTVELGLPRFTFKTSYRLKKALQALGMKAAFDKDRANFRGVASFPGNERLYLADVIHKAFVETNEEGTEAAAVTVVHARSVTTSVPPPPVRFVADHPFLFLIRHRPTGAVLFLGRVQDPTQPSA